MTSEWIRFALVAALVVTGLTFLCISLLGVCRFRFALNRLHAAAIADTAGIMFMMAALTPLYGFSIQSLRLLLIILFMFISSPVSAHLITKLEYMTAEDLAHHVAFEDADGETAPAGAGEGR